MIAHNLKQSSLESLSGTLLIAMPQLKDARFFQSVVLICGHDKKGAMGLIINKILDEMTLTQLLTKVGVTHQSTAFTSTFPVYNGGPVETGRGFILHSPEFTQATSVLITPSIAMTSTLDMLALIAEDKGPHKKICALGYTGWGVGQLEKEIQANCWLQIPADDAIIFNEPLENRWLLALQYLGISPKFLSLDVGHA